MRSAYRLCAGGRTQVCGVEARAADLCGFGRCLAGACVTDDLILSYPSERDRRTSRRQLVSAPFGRRTRTASHIPPALGATVLRPSFRLPHPYRRIHGAWRAFMAHGMQVSQWAAANILERAWTSIPRSTVCVGPILCRRPRVSAVSAWRGRCIRGHALLCARACEQAAARVGYVRAYVCSVGMWPARASAWS